jgi:hypothetical protein
MGKTAINFRIDEGLLALIDQIDKNHRVGNRTTVVEWLLTEGAARLRTYEIARREWAGAIVEEHGEKAVVSVRLTATTAGRDPEYRAEARVDSKPSDLIEAEVLRGPTGEVRVVLRNPSDDRIPLVLFGVLTEAELGEAVEESGWGDSPDLLLTMARSVSELQGLPIHPAPGNAEPPTPPDLSGGSR